MWMLRTIQTQMLEVLATSLVTADPAWSERIRPIVGCRVRIRVDDLPIDWIIQPFERQIKVWPGASDDDEDVLVHGPWQAFLHTARTQGPDAPMTVGALQIKGNASVAQVLMSSLMALSPDWRSQLAPWLGDAAADTLVQIAENVESFVRQAFAQQKAQCVDVARHQLGLIAERAAFEDFQQALVALSSDVARVQARLTRLERQLS